MLLDPLQRFVRVPVLRFQLQGGLIFGRRLLQVILALEQIDQCSCCASQVCGCDNAGSDINAATQAEITKLNAEQERLEITPQCQINGTLCGAETP